MRISDLLRGVVALAAVLALAALMTRGQETDSTGLAEVIDGDSLRLNGVEMRLEGIDAPEYRQTCRRQAAEWDCGLAARAALRGLLARAVTTCVGAEHDLYGRLLVVCRVRGLDINAEMVRTGNAVALRGYAGEEKEARADARGIWAGPFELPRDWRREHPRPAR